MPIKRAIKRASALHDIISAFAEVDVMHSHLARREGYAAGVGFKMPYVVAWGEYDGVARSDGTAGGGASITVMPRVPGVGELIFRFDEFDANRAVGGDQLVTVVGGVSHTFAEKTAVTLTFEQAIIGGDSSSAGRGIYARWQAGF